MPGEMQLTGGFAITPGKVAPYDSTAHPKGT